MGTSLLTNEQDAYLRKIAYGKTVKECTALINDMFHTNFKASQIRSYKNNHKILSGMPQGYFLNKVPKNKLLTQEQHEFLINNYKLRSNKELTDLINKEFDTNFKQSQIEGYKRNRRLDSGLTGRFEKGNVPSNKGKKMSADQYEKAKKTMFKKGHLSYNSLPIGTERVREDGYVVIKIANGKLNKNWKQKHILIWEKAHGKLPDGKVVIFLDGNNRNFDLDNLVAIDKSIHLIMNRNHLYVKDKELVKSGIATAELIKKISDIKKDRKLK